MKNKKKILYLIIGLIGAYILGYMLYPHNHEHGERTNTHGDENIEHEHLNEDHEHDNNEEHLEDTDHNGNQEQEHDHAEGEIIEVDEKWAQLIGLKTEKVQRKAIELTISVPGQIIPNQDKIAFISPFIESSVNSVFANLGQRVKKGEVLACLTSPEVGILNAEYNKAKAELDIKNKDFERKKKLFEENIISNKSFQQAESELNIAMVNYNYARKKLLAMGISEQEIDDPPSEHSEAVGATIHLKTPISGVVTHRNASIGQKVNGSVSMFEVVDLEEVWLEADVFEKDLSKIKIAQKVKVNVSAYPEDRFRGEIFYIASVLNKETKTIKILVNIENKSEKLKPGMFANTQIIVGEKNNTLVAPKNAILEDESLNIVFIKEQNHFVKQIVELGIVSDRYAEIINGVHENDFVVIQGNYQLKSKAKMSTVDPHAGHSH